MLIPCPFMNHSYQPLTHNLYSPRVLDPSGPENGGYTAIASTRPGKPAGFIEVEFPGFGRRFPIKFNN